MTIESIKNEAIFIAKLTETLTPTFPISTIERLRGRERELETVRRALVMPGRHVFIYGDRGVGKSSLAHTAATQYQSAVAAPIIAPGASDSTFQSIIADIAIKALGRSRIQKSKTTKRGSVSWHGLTLGLDQEISPVDLLEQIKTIGDATGLLAEVCKFHSESPIIVIDEFDAISNVEERNKFASLLKQIGDLGISIRFIFTGVGSSMHALLGAHQSAYRQLETIELARLGWDGRREIAVQTAQAFGVDIDPNIAWRIAIVSDGFPSFVHLIMEKVLWEAFTDEKQVDELGPDQYLAGLKVAINSITGELLQPYKKAVLLRSEEYESIVWATADGENLHRNISDMYESYKVVCRKRQHDVLLTQAKFAERLRQLKSPSYGQVLQSIESRPGWYIYREKMLRGYVRMQAESEGVELSGEREAPKQQIHVPSARIGYRGSSVPRGVKFGRERSISRMENEEE